MNADLCITPRKSMISTPTSSRCLQPPSSKPPPQNALIHPPGFESGLVDSAMGTPNSRTGNPIFTRRSLLTPSKIFNKKSGTFNLLPVINTPPSRRFPRVINPFDAALTDRLHLPLICSPLFRSQSPLGQSSMVNMSTTDSVNSKSSGMLFEWTIDDVSLLSAANVVPCESQFHHTPDPELEAKAQAAISSFFKEQQIASSPINCSLRGPKINLTGFTGECSSIEPNHFFMERGLSEVNMSYTEDEVGIEVIKTQTKQNKKMRHGCSQTVLSMPPKLPTGVEEILASYFTYNEVIL